MAARVLIALLVLAACVAVSASSHVLYTRTSVPQGWHQGPRAPATTPVSFTLALKQRNLDILDKWFTESSDPQHANYLSFKSIDEIKDLVSPAASDKVKVLQWLSRSGIRKQDIKDFGDAIDVHTTVKKAEKAFSTKFFSFRHKETGVKIARSFGAYSVPHSMKHLVEMVTGISTFPIPHLKVNRKTVERDNTDPTVEYGIVPQTLNTLYSISQSARDMIKDSASVYTSQGVIEFQNQDFAPADLAQFGQALNLPVQVVGVNETVGPNDPTQPQGEPSLDIQYVAGVNLGADNWFWLENGNGWLYQFGIHFFSTQNVPQVNSISYGWWEGDQCTIDGTECQALGVDSTGYVQRVNVEFQKIGSRGVSLLCASGDSGANGRTDGDCSDPQLRPSFPASSPYITAVGATELVQASVLATQPALCGQASFTCAASGTEQAVSFNNSNFASGGGFSAIATMPAYQMTAVNGYLNSGVALPPASYFNATGRAFPDVAAMGHNLLTIVGGQPSPASGTSASSPIFSAVVALLNVAQIQLTGKPLGFLNPFLYQMAAAQPNAFQDITVGDNKCTENGCAPTCQGYLATKGWDPVTGLGTPNAANMLSYVKAGRHIKNKSLIKKL